MTDDILKELRRQQEWINKFLEPSRRMQEELLRSLAPVMQIKESLRLVTDNLASMGVTGDILQSMERIGRVELADFSRIAALTATERDLAGVTDAIKQQSRWIEEASGLSFAKGKWILADSGALAAIEKLTASQNALLDTSRWLTPRPFASAITDIFLMGRSKWALTFPAVPPSGASVDDLTHASEQMTARFAAVGDSASVSIRPEDAERQVAAVARVLGDISPTFTLERDEGGRTRLDTSEEAEASQNFETIIEVACYIEAVIEKPIGAGYSGWLARYTVNVMNASRSDRDRFCSVINACHDLFVDGIENADGVTAKKSPAFFRETIKDLRDTLCAHAPEAAKPAEWVAESLRKRDRRLREVSGSVPVRDAEWQAARHALLKKAAEAAIEFRDRLA